jgi:hypothetical protein
MDLLRLVMIDHDFAAVCVPNNNRRPSQISIPPLATIRVHHDTTLLVSQCQSFWPAPYVCRMHKGRVSSFFHIVYGTVGKSIYYIYIHIYLCLSP